MHGGANSCKRMCDVKIYVTMCVYNNVIVVLSPPPEDPKAYLIDYLGQLKEAKDNRVEGPCLFNDSNLDSVFGVLDPANEGHITSAQYMEGKQRIDYTIVLNHLTTVK